MLKRENEKNRNKANEECATKREENGEGRMLVGDWRTVSGGGGKEEEEEEEEEEGRIVTSSVKRQWQM
ncbi:unnamed protein product [Protopolystoma xenopodis]|uniref:Uncharacterized protein n=1 Tax=Protopolystoma xenopodis TaxID=117903 RepID=A0A3S5AED0_9PLAT|nr:unnamed protein product [Protopolystoma xenopodis]